MDLVLVHSGKVIALEIKSNHSQHASGMEALHRQYKPDKVILVGNSGIPWQEFLEINPLELFN